MNGEKACLIVSIIFIGLVYISFDLLSNFSKVYGKVYKPSSKCSCNMTNKNSMRAL